MPVKIDNDSMSVSQAARLLGVSTSYLYALIKCGSLKARTVTKYRKTRPPPSFTRLLIDRKSLAEYLAKHGAEADQRRTKRGRGRPPRISIKSVLP